MKILFLGTGAAALARTPNSEVKPDQRRCSSLLLDGNVIVDIALQSFDYATALGVDTAAVTDVFLSHLHVDHYSKVALMQYAEASSRKLNFWCHESAVEYLKLTEEELDKINLCPVKIMEPFEAAGMRVTALPANHVAAPNEQPVHYIFEKDGQVLFYGCDGGWLRCETWQYIYRNHIVFTAMILDATVGDLPGNFRIGEHNTIPMLRLLLAAMRENGALSPKATLIANHIGIPPYDRENEGDFGLLGELGMIVANDGMEIEC